MPIYYQFEKGNQIFCASNYRGISLPDILSKLLERNQVFALALISTIGNNLSP